MAKNGNGGGLLGLIIIGVAGFAVYATLSAGGGSLIPVGGDVFPDITDEDLFGELSY